MQGYSFSNLVTKFETVYRRDSENAFWEIRKINKFELFDLCVSAVKKVFQFRLLRVRSSIG